VYVEGYRRSLDILDEAGGPACGGSPALGLYCEGVLSPDGRKIVFTSLKGGDLDIYV